LRRLTLRQAFALGIAGLALLLGVLFLRIDWSSRVSLLESSAELRQEKTRRMGDRVLADLGRRDRALDQLASLLRTGAVPADTPGALEAALFAEVQVEPALSEAGFTHAVRGPDGRGLSPDRSGRFQVSVYRPAEEEGRVFTRYDHVEGGHFVCDARERPAGGGLASAPFERQARASVPDPTAHLTFQAALAREPGAILASDLHWSELDAHLPQERRRVVVTGQTAVVSAAGSFLGVLRVGLVTSVLDRLVQPEPGDPHRVFLCDAEGRLITALAPGDSVKELGDDLRVVSPSLPPEIAAALALPALRAIGPAQPSGSGAVLANGETYRVGFRYIEGSQDWIVGIVAPESAYLGNLPRERRSLLLASLGIMGLILAAGWLALGGVRRGLETIERSTARMRDFDFSPGRPVLRFRELQDVGDRLELAKTAMRAMGRYVPVDLVRLLYRTGREPVLGGELLEISLLFTDIQGFTTLSERLPPNELARALGSYFEVMTAAVHRHQGIIDKYIGDAIMAIWNAPTPCPEHPRRACEAALACIRAADELFLTPAWAGLPRLVTRFGIHCDRSMVGHFGAPDRMSYTALGDGVNLAARLEGLNKQYGTTVLVSDAVRQQAEAWFEFRLLDRVAVKGKERGIEVSELVGPKGTHVPDRLRAYERALASYWARDFAAAAHALASLDDPPSRVLLERCQRFAAVPPPADWDGVWVATSK
jgi:adenylate cyclase